MYKNISQFENTTDYLPILNAALLTDLIFIFFLIFGVIHSIKLEEWYRKYTIAAVIEDVLILVIGILLARFFYKPIFGEKFSLIKFTVLAVFIQIIHDILFYLFFTLIPKGKNKMMDTFKEYSREIGFRAIIADSCMMMLTAILSSCFSYWNFNSNIITLILIIYLIPYAIYTF